MGTILVCETFSRQNPQLDGQILFCPDVSTGHFQKLFRALYVFLYIRCYPFMKSTLVMQHCTFKCSLLIGHFVNNKFGATFCIP